MTREDQFITIYQKDWEVLEEFIKRISKKGYKKLSNQELKKYLHLTKKVSHHLAIVKSNYPNSDLILYLNDLVVRANNNLYVVEKLNMKKVLNYFINDFATKVRANKGAMFASFGIFMAAMLLGYILVQIDSGFAGYFLPEEFMMRDDWSMENAAWQEQQFAFLSSYVTINNIGVCIKSFAYGILAGIPTLYVLFVNGAMLGALSSLVEVNAGNFTNYLALILPHGIIELTAIFISGGAGLMIGKSLLIPGQYTRGKSVIKGAKEAASIMPGVILMLVLAGLIEGFFTPAKLPASVKLIFAGFTFLLLVLYFGFRRK